MVNFMLISCKKKFALHCFFVGDMMNSRRSRIRNSQERAEASWIGYSIFGVIYIYTGWWFQMCFIFIPKIGEMIQCWLIFSKGLNPPTSIYICVHILSWKITCPPTNDGWKSICFPFEMVPFQVIFVHLRGGVHSWKENEDQTVIGWLLRLVVYCYYRPLPGRNVTRNSPVFFKANQISPTFFSHGLRGSASHLKPTMFGMKLL